MNKDQESHMAMRGLHSWALVNRYSVAGQLDNELAALRQLLARFPFHRRAPQAHLRVVQALEHGVKFYLRNSPRRRELNQQLTEGWFSTAPARLGRNGIKVIGARWKRLSRS